MLYSQGIYLFCHDDESYIEVLWNHVVRYRPVRIPQSIKEEYYSRNIVKGQMVCQVSSKNNKHILFIRLIQSSSSQTAITP